MPKKINICLAQINPTVGDIEGNLCLLRSARNKALHLGADLVVFSELVVTGYPPEDLMLNKSFQDAAQDAVQQLAVETNDNGPAILLGAPWREESILYNAVLLLEGGVISASRFKHHLPNYGVFDEARIFAPGDLPGPIFFKDILIGAMVCEDMWFNDVSECLQESGAQILISINGSPFEANKSDERLSHAVSRVTETGLPMIYVNQIGGQDELVFDGGSFVIGKDKSLRAQAPSFDETILSTLWKLEDNNLTCKTSEIFHQLEGPSSVYKAMTLGLRDYVEKNNFPGVLIGLSGGIDSALSLAIAVDAIGPEKVHCVLMPSKFTSKESINDATESSLLLNVQLENIPIEPLVDAFNTALAGLFKNLKRDATEENLQARIRAIILMALSNKFGYMVLTTGNKSEMSVGYATLYGDMCGGYSVLKDLYKTSVFNLAEWRNKNILDGLLGPDTMVVPEQVLTKKPSAELSENQFDEDTLPPYETLDEILSNLIERDNTLIDMQSLGHEKYIVSHIENMLNMAEYKRRQAPPGVKLTRKSFGKERRYPITNRFRGNKK